MFDGSPPAIKQEAGIERSESPPKDAENRYRERLRTQTLARFFTSAQVNSSQPSAEPVAPKLSEDKHLTALAQLGPLKLACDRSFISLLGTSTQYIIAEATRTISLRDASRYSTPQDALALGTQKLDATWGVCPQTLKIFTDQSSSSEVDTQEIVANKSRYVIRDFRELDVFKEKPYVTGFPHMVSYLQVPMRATNGCVIGSYCVVDTKRRDDFFFDKTVEVLDEIASSIMEYLETVTTGRDHERGSRLLTGLSLFAEGSSPFRKGAGVTAHNLASMDTQSRPHSRGAGITDTSPNTPQGSAVSPFALPTSTSTTESSVHFSAGTSQGMASRDDTDMVESRPRVDTSLFPRVAHLIREAMEMEGLVFLDGPVQQEPHVPPQDDIQVTPQQNGTPRRPTVVRRDTGRNCRVLGSSVGSNRIAGLSNGSERSLAVDEASMSFLIDQYPHGRIFHSDSQGILTSDVDTFKPGAEEGNHPHLPFEISKLLKTARSVIFLPLWDFTKENLVAGMFGWTSDPARIFSKEDFTCLSAFGDAICNEISRLEAIGIARAKSDFVSSISHELRSPLHGILASAEVLSTSLTNEGDLDMIHMIESCGSTLLDTLNHLLDFSRVSRQKSVKGDALESASLVPTDEAVSGKVVDGNLAKLIVSVVEGVYFGYLSKGRMHQQLTDSLNQEQIVFTSEGTKRRRQETEHENYEPVAILIDVENRTDWEMSLQVGGWKRVCMNLVSNSLKYTESGSIEIAMSKVSLDHGEAVRFAVTDSGIGMSPEYLKHRLFRPFAQENENADGSGLGLSIVKQIVSNMNGTIDVQSEVGRGTRIEVLIPILPNHRPIRSYSIASQIDSHSDLRGKKLCIVSDVHSAYFDQVSAGLSKSREQRLSAMQNVVTRTATTWFGMSVETARRMEDCESDFYLMEISRLAGHPSSRIRPPGKVIAVSYRQAGSKYGSAFNTVEYPVCPKTLGKALLRSMRDLDNGDKMRFETVRDSAEEGRDMTPQTNGTSPHEMANRNASRPSHSTTKVKHLLLVDDNAINLKILKSYVDKLKCTAITATNGKEAVDRYEQSGQHFDLIFMDISMPVMDGFEASKQIRALEHQRLSEGQPRTRIIALSGLGSEASREKSISSGIDSFLTKPVPLKDLKTIVDSLE